MPVENELKYVLPLHFDEARLAGWDKYDIKQAYLDDGPRIRQLNSDYFFTYKKWIPEAGELVEVETALSENDYNMLLTQCVESVQKTRYKKHIGDAEWVVDFLKDKFNQAYFVMSEVEMPRHQLSPNEIPEEIRNDIIYAAEQDDVRFTNKNLSNAAHAANLYKELAPDVG